MFLSSFGKQSEMSEVTVTVRTLCIHWFFLCLSFISSGYSGSLRIPIEGQLVYDTVSKTGNLCISPHMCPPCILNSLCQLNMDATSTPYSTEVSSATTPPTPTTSPTTEATTSSTAATETATSTEEPTSSSSTVTSSSSSTQMTATNEPTETTTTGSTRPTEAATTATGTVGAKPDFFQDGLQGHNEYRKVHDAPPLTLSPNLNSDAQATAERIASLGKLIHTEDTGGQGENLARFCTSDELSPDEIITTAVDKWYKEVCKYDFDNPGFSPSSGHFTQLVWKSTKEVGFGWSSKEENGLTCYYVVARYYPEGNIDTVSQFQENVKKGSFDSSYCAKKRNLHSIKCYGKMAVFL